MGGTQLQQELEAVFGFAIDKMSPVQGGDIAKSYLLETKSAHVFLKFLGQATGLSMLQAEAEGLLAIGSSGVIKVPEVLGCTTLESGAALLLEYVKPGAATTASYQVLGRGLALLHQVTSDRFGWPKSNFIGSLPQVNAQEDDWALFYARQRLLPQYDMARASGMLADSETPSLEVLTSRISSLLPVVTPSLLHGDLWGGNYIISKGGNPYLIDPAVYYGHAEVDLAMSRLFGGFPSEFYTAYFEVNPPSPGLEDRILLYQLYYLLVHLNLFGSSYHRQVSDISSRLFL